MSVQLRLQREANQLVEEFMLLANMTTARMVAEAWPDRCVWASHAADGAGACLALGAARPAARPSAPLPLGR